MKTELASQSFLNNQRARSLSPQTIQWYERTLKRFTQAFPELPTDPGEVEEFLISLNVCPETKCTYFKGIKAFYHFVSRRCRVADPTAYIAPPRRPRKVMPTLEPRELMQLINLAVNLRDRAMMTVFTDTGARCGEIAGLRRQDINDDSIRVNGKTGERMIPISEETRRLLLALISADGESEYVFTSRLGRPLSRTGVYFIIRSLMEKAGIQRPKIGPTRIRHAFGKGYLVNGGDLRSLQEIMGHADISTTQKYASLNRTDITAKHHKFTPLRAAHAAAQGSLFDTSQALKEAEAILERSAE